MGETVVSTSTLPVPIRERLNASRVTVHRHGYGVILMPVNDVASLRGAGRGSSFTVDALLATRREERIMEERGDAT
jgi:virulence-associated protein VagC